MEFVAYLDHDPLSHGESILVVSTAYLEDESFVLISEAVAFDFLSHSLLDEVDTE